MAFTPWTQQRTLPPGSPEKQPPKEFTDKELEDLRTRGFGQRTIEMFQAGTVTPPEETKFKPTWTWPWQAEHYDKPGGEAAKWALGIGLGAGGAALGLAAPGALGWLSQYAPWLTSPALAGMGGLAQTGLAIGGGLTGATIAGGMTPEAPIPTPPGTEPTGPPDTGPTEGESRVNYGPTGIPFLETWDGTKWVGPEQAEGEVGVPSAEPQVQEIGGQQFWWDPTGGMYGTGGWSLIPSRGEQISPEQTIQMTEAERAHQMEMLQEQYRLEQQTMTQQGGQARGMQEAAAAQQMAQMYAADPYKYWAQMGQGTPGAVARLTGGQVRPGEQMQQGVPLSTPSAQWWGNLLPSEQQQISGGLNWMGIDPQDWYSMYQRMIPGQGSRQLGPAWAR